MRWLTNAWRWETVGKVRWLEGKVIGEPKATAKYSVEQLEQMGVVGVYEEGKK